MTARLQLSAVEWPEVEAGADLAGLVLASTSLQDGDVLVLTSKVVSKAEDRGARVDRDRLVAIETSRVVARRGTMVIAETRHGLVMAAAGVDVSNTEQGRPLALPLDPDGTARRLRQELLDRSGLNVAVVVSDTAGRAWRIGQTDMAIGCAGLEPIDSLVGHRDAYGNELRATLPAVADEVAAAADLVKAKLAGRPLAVVRGLTDQVLPPGRHGPGAAGLVRPHAEDLFSLGSREAAVAATVRDDPATLDSFAPWTDDDEDPFARLVAPADVLVAVESGRAAHGGRQWTVDVAVDGASGPAGWLAAGAAAERVRALAAAHRLRFAPVLPPDLPGTVGPVVVDRSCWVTS